MTDKLDDRIGDAKRTLEAALATANGIRDIEFALGRAAEDVESDQRARQLTQADLMMPMTV